MEGKKTQEQLHEIISQYEGIMNGFEKNHLFESTISKSIPQDKWYNTNRYFKQFSLYNEEEKLTNRTSINSNYTNL
jgi:hypothetical protein